jgi:mannose/cellobiose epimerase-like protein (N-acyl-D-glucosamine 2-epimerase family)
MMKTTERTPIDFSWFKGHLLNEILPLWRKSISEEGLFLPHFDRQWQKGDLEYGTLVSQSRLLYSFACGYRLTGDMNYKKAVESGSEFLLSHFRDREFGGWFWSCHRDGMILDRSKDCYGHAFTIFGLSHAYPVTGNRDLLNAAIETWEVMRSCFRDPYGGFVQGMNQAFTEESEDFKSQNPVMHLFEALLALSKLDGMGSYQKEAEEIANFVLTKLVREDDHILPELYTMDWQALTSEQNGRIDIGHALEWSFLLSSAVEQGYPQTYLDHAVQFLRNGIELGYDPMQGGVFSPASPEGELLTSVKGWWQQCELIRSLSHFAVIRGMEELWEYVEKSIRFIKESFIDNAYGGWFQTVDAGESGHNLSQQKGWKVSPRIAHLKPQGKFIPSDKGSEWKVDYHVVGMCTELSRPEYLRDTPDA